MNEHDNENPKRARRNRIVAWIAAIGFAIVLIAGPLSASSWAERGYSLALILGSAALLALATRRIGFSLAAPTIVFGGLLIAGALKFRYLTSPLLAPDLLYFLNRDLYAVATRYPSIMMALTAGAILIPGLLILTWVIDRPRLLASKPRRRRLAIQTIGVLACLIAMIIINSPGGPFKKVFAKGMWARMNDRSYIADFFTSFYQTEIVVPPVYGNALPKISWTQAPAQNPPACESPPCVPDKHFAQPQKHPDIVAILEESTFNPKLLAVCNVPECNAHMFQADDRTRAHGLLTVHVWGGGTWTSEFALLTGLNHNSFGEAGLYAPYNLAPRVVSTLPRVLHKAGYRVIAIYPMSGDFINARNAYKDYGFDKFYDGQIYGLSWDSTDADLVKVFDKIYAKEKNRIGVKPLFIMMLTLHQHGPHMTPLKELPAPYNKPLFPDHFTPKDLDDWLNLNLDNYLERLSESDTAISHVEHTLLDSGRPALLFHFGDHQPSFDGAIRELKKVVPASVPDANFITYYMLETNFQPTRKYDYPVLDLSYAGGLILDVAGIKKDPFFQANALLRQRCNGAYLDCPDKPLLDTYKNYVFHQLGDVNE